VSGGQAPGNVGTSSGNKAVHRGVRWRRSSGGQISWFNDGLGRWVAWSPDSDAPPLPPGWAQGASSRDVAVETVATPATAPADAMSNRSPMRSPYRLVPLLIVVFIVAIAAWQATRPASRASHADIAAAEALKGQCLARDGGTADAPVYSATPVSCNAGGGSVRVVAVLVAGHNGPTSCPKGSSVVQVLAANVAGEPSECVLPLR
jgi:hypothetical protein